MQIGQSFADGTLAATRRQISSQDLHDLRRNGSGYGWAAPSEHMERYRVDFHAAVWCCVDGRLACDGHSAKLRGMTSLG